MNYFDLICGCVKWWSAISIEYVRLNDNVSSGKFSNLTRYSKIFNKFSALGFANCFMRRLNTANLTVSILCNRGPYH